MKELTITITGRETHDLVYALEDAKNSIESGCSSGSNGSDDGEYYFDIKEVNE